MKRTDKRLSILGLLIIAICNNVFANGDPVVKYSSINRVANPEPLSISEIRIVSEQVNITHVDGYNCFDITYQLHNNSFKDFPEIHYGFPIDYLVSDEQETFQMTGDYITESQYETGWCDKLIKDVAFVFNDKELQFHSAKESVREAGYEVMVYEDVVYGDSIPIDAINRRWFYTQFSMPSQSEATLNVRYKVYANSKIGLYEDFRFSKYERGCKDENSHITNHPMLLRYFPYRFSILYDFTPAKHFGNGKAFPLEVDIDLSNIDNPRIELDDFECFTSHLTRRYYTDTEDVEPINLMVYVSDSRKREDIERKIAPFIVPSDKYKMRQSDKYVEIDFHKPTFVSELACDIDTALVKSIGSTVTFADGRQKEYQYRQEHQYKSDKRILSPILLTITDLLHDGLRWFVETEELSNWTGDFDNPRFKIKKIRLDFETSASSSTTPLQHLNLRVLDSRFNK